MSSPDGRTRVAILGGGCGAMSTAFWLTATEDLRSRYQVSVYTQGWRLGGKGASGRQHDESDRILEHGLHMWMGWYEVAFSTIRLCYDEWKKSPENPFQTWRDAFTPLSLITLEQRVPVKTGDWQTWRYEAPTLPGTPGDPADDLDDVLDRLLAWLRNHFGAHEIPSTHLDNAHSAARSAAEAMDAARDALLEEVKRCLIAAQTWFHASELVLGGLPFEFELRALADIGLAVAIGFVEDVVPVGEAGFANIDPLEFRDWLKQHGATEPYVWTAPVRCLYDLGFAYVNGDSSSEGTASAAAGVALRVLLSSGIGYREAPLWKMNAGMGDTIFTPFYEVLSARGVDFHFFSRVLDVGLSTDGTRTQVETIELSRQVELADEPYDPFVQVKGLPCWPSEPRWDLIVGGEPPNDAAWDLESAWCLYEVLPRPKPLVRGADFDVVVLALPPAVLPLIGPDLLTRSKPLADMYANVPSVVTQSAQLWLKPDLVGLGWPYGPTVLTAYAEPFRSWGEMSHLIARESWTGVVPGSLEYFCGTIVPPAMLPPFGDPKFVEDQTARVAGNFARWSDAGIGHLFPNAIGPGGQGFNRSLVVSEFYRVNIDPSELYVQSPPGSTAYRLHAAGSGVANLYLAGDWTRTRVNGGCVEAAVESGRNAAEAICGHPIDLSPPREA